ncbi:DUF317 domain-containing protein [Streptomyces sp. NPDC005962]|uniref:DUF317 domain-containing protein n=1 Tax=Streptomyces sp. NPDC005962 TaxID=3154466 RepID=UPI0033E9D46D
MPPTPATVEVNFIAPRHLAGGGDPAWITVPLHRACGWSDGGEPLIPRVMLSSPDHKAVLRLEPVPDGPWWILHHSAEPDRPAWYASFGARTPVEAIAGFLDDLTDPTPGGSTEADPYEPLLQANWSPARIQKRLVSPFGTACVRRLDGAGSGPWFVTALNDARPVWQAVFAEHTPTRLIAAFTTALADPSPVPRTGSPLKLPTRDPDLVTLTHREVPAAQVSSALEDRVRALTARSKQPAPAPQPPKAPPHRPAR